MSELAVLAAHDSETEGTDATYSEAVLKGILAASPDCVKVLSVDGRL